MAFWRLRGPRSQELKPSRCVLEAGGQSPGRVSGVTPRGLLPVWQFPLHVEFMLWLARHRPLGVLTSYLLGTTKKKDFRVPSFKRNRGVGLELHLLEKSSWS